MIDFDLVLVIGLVLAAFSVPSMLSAWIDSRPPRSAAIILLIAGVLIVVALTQSPSPYTVTGLPHVFVEVIGRYLK